VVQAAAAAGQSRRMQGRRASNANTVLHIHFRARSICNRQVPLPVALAGAVMQRSHDRCASRGPYHSATYVTLLQHCGIAGH
jgi:hypothetical protein